MGRRIMKKILMVLGISAFFVALISILALAGCSDTMLQDIQDKIVQDGVTYKVTYAANGATGGIVPVDNGTYKEGAIVTVIGNTGSLIKTGYTYIGWNTEGDRSGIHYVADNTFEMGSSDVTLYAEWTNDALEALSYRDMVSVTGGTFTQQSDVNGDGDVSDPFESFSHTISNFSIGKYEVTYELWYTVHDWALSNGYTFANLGRKGNDGTGTIYDPVTTINWRDAIVWCNAYSEMSGYTPVYYTDAAYTTPLKTSTNNTTINDVAGSEDNPYVKWSANGYQLLTEGEWQYAASNKGGTPWNYASGATADYTDATETQKVAWYSANSGNTTHNVGTKTANQLVIYDMSGNVWEWCWDWEVDYPLKPKKDYIGPSSGSSRVMRGGSWGADADLQQLGYRNSINPYGAYYNIGFRVALGQ